MKRSKYRAIPTVVDGIRFASKAEAKHYSRLKILERAGKISNLITQKRFPLCVTPNDTNVPDIWIGSYVADFIYLENGKLKIIDVKGFKTQLYSWKKKHFEAQYGIKITEVRT